MISEPGWMENAISSETPTSNVPSAWGENNVPQDPSYSFYNGTRILYFNKDRHEYYEYDANGDKRIVKGVTTVLGILDKPYLKPWVAKVTIEAVRKGLFTGGALRDDMSTEEVIALLESAKKEHTNRLEYAGDIGTLAHDSIEDAINYAIANSGGVVLTCPKVVAKEWHGNPTEEELQKAQTCAEAAFAWMQGHRVVWLATEQKVLSAEYNYCGTADGDCLVSSCGDRFCKGCRGRVFENRRAVPDWKSSNQISITYLWQTAAYLFAIIEMEGVVIQDRWIIRLGKDEPEFEVLYMPAEEFEMHFNAFLACLNLYTEHDLSYTTWNESKKAFNQFVRETKKAEREQREAEEKEARAQARRELSEAKKEWDEQNKALYRILRAKGLKKAEAEEERDRQMPKSSRPGAKDESEQNENVDAPAALGDAIDAKRAENTTHNLRTPVASKKIPVVESQPTSIPTSTVRRVKRV